jgi:hypothetical protein
MDFQINHNQNSCKEKGSMGDRTSRGEPERVGEIIRRCIEADARTRYYRPQRPFRHAKQKKPIESMQLAFRFPESVRDFERPLVDLIPEAYAGK